ncbi:MAG TPA: hypothetical protein VE544_07880 [Nitrososphaeraceae archaeon]|nr:hypothetical protein [Nitrososphaeraceae archaeon]
MKGLIVKDKNGCRSYLIAATTVAFFLFMMMPNYSALAYTEHGSGDKSSSSSSGTMYFRVLKGDLNVCSPNYQQNVTICQTVMKNEELLPHAGEVTNSIHSNNATNSTNPTNSSSFPPLSVDPEMVISEEQLQTLLINSSSNPIQRAENVSQNGNGTIPSNDTQLYDIGKIYVDEYAQYEPLVVEQPLEEEISITNSLQRPWHSSPQPFFMNNQTASNEAHDIEEPVLPENAIRQQDNHQDSMSNKEGLRLSERPDNPKADTSNSYSSIPIGMSLPLGN